MEDEKLLYNLADIKIEPQKQAPTSENVGEVLSGIRHLSEAFSGNEEFAEQIGEAVGEMLKNLYK